MNKKQDDKLFDSLPACAAEFIKLIIKKMRYRRKVRAQVQAELAAHFEDELRDCKTDEDKEQKAQKLISEFGNPKLLGVLLRRAKKRCRPLWRTVVARASQAIVIIFVCLVVYIGWFLSGKPVVTVDYLAELNRMVRPSADDNFNAAPFYIEAAQLSEDWPKDISELLGKKYNDVNDVQKQRIERFLEDNIEALELVTAGSKKPYYWREYDNGGESEGMMGILIPNLAGYRKIARALCWRAQLQAGQGRYKDAFDDLMACYRFGRHLKGDKTLVEQLVGFGIEALSGVRCIRQIVNEFKVDSALLAALQENLEREIRDEDFTVSFETEKLFIYDEIQRCFTEGIFGTSHLYIPRAMVLEGSWLEEPEHSASVIVLMTIMTPQRWPDVFEVLFAHPNKRQTKQMSDKFYAFWDKIADKTPAQIRAEGIDVEAKVDEFIENNILLSILAPAFSRIIEISYRCKVDVLASLSIIAIERYRQDTGQYPSTLRQLVEAGYLKELPMDPFSDKPLVYRTTDDGFILYGVGTNFKDDGGEIAIDDRGRIQEYAYEGDWVFWPVNK